MTQLLLEPEEQVSELLSVFQNKVSRLLVSQNFSLQGRTLLLPKAVLTQLLEICMRITGNGTSMIPSKEVIGLQTKTQFNT